ncbi:CMRF35-like molecule 9 isoform X2 [Parambassis ranga]|uniref:CMRF35-like molecule 9 isoform X2 n=1 Tax=Parambassis ranga TaxID=210632 RepID=A0A6P7I3H6_9TELE|nr:CMRF35-like molecule 9 isoform X2 [Parambassis ranga]
MNSGLTDLSARLILLFIFIMMKTYLCVCLLSAVVDVQAKINIKGSVGQNVTATCLGWNVWLSDVKTNDKYICRSPCTEQKHIITQAAYKKTKRKDRIEITNSDEGLFVTFFNLQKSESGTYYCGVERYGRDSFIEVNLKVTDAEHSKHRTPAVTVIVTPTVSSAVLTNITVSNGSNTVTDSPPTSYITTSALAMQQVDIIPYLIFGLLIISIALMVLLKHMRGAKRQQNITSFVHCPPEVAQNDAVYEEVGLNDQQSEGQPAAAVSTPSTDIDPDSLYANYFYQLPAKRHNRHSTNVSLIPTSSSDVDPKHACAEGNDVVYSLAQLPQLPKKESEYTGQCKPNDSHSIEYNDVYSLALLPQVT